MVCEREGAQGGGEEERPEETVSVSFFPFFSLSIRIKKQLLCSQGTLTMTRAHRKHSPTSSAAATRHSASASPGSQSRRAIVALSDQRVFCILVAVIVAFVDRAAPSGFAPPARARRVVAAIRRRSAGCCCAWRERERQNASRQAK